MNCDPATTNSRPLTLEAPWQALHRVKLFSNPFSCILDSCLSALGELSCTSCLLRGVSAAGCLAAPVAPVLFLVWGTSRRHLSLLRMVFHTAFGLWTGLGMCCGPTWSGSTAGKLTIQHSWLFTHCSLQKLQAADVKNMPFSPLTNALQQSDHLLIAQEHLLIRKGCQKFQFWLKTRVSTYVLTPRCGGARRLAEEGPPGMCVGVCTNRLMLGMAPTPAVGISKSPCVQGMGFTCSEGAGWAGWCGQDVPHPGLPHRQEGGGHARPSGSARPGDTGRASPAASSLAQIFTRNVKKNNREINKKPSDLTQLEYLFWKIYWIREQETH